MSGPRRPGRGARILVAIVLLLAMGALFAGLSAQLIGGYRDDLRRTATERQAVPYLRAVSQLIADLVEARSAAVRAEADPPASLSVSVTALSDVEVAQGGAWPTADRRSQLAAAIDLVLAERPTGQDAADRYADLVTMARDLLDEVSAASELDADPQPASRSLVEAVRELLRLVVATGQAADASTLAATAGSNAAADVSSAADVDDGTADLVELAVALHDAATAYRALVGMLTTSVGPGSQPLFPAAVVEQLNLIHDALAPAVGPAAVLPATDADRAAVSGVARQVREVVRPTTEVVLEELDRQLARRAAALDNQLLTGMGTAAAGLVVGLVVLWWSAAPPAPSSEQSHDVAPGGLDVASVSVDLPAVDARELLALEELVHVGRGVRARPPGGGEDAE